MSSVQAISDEFAGLGLEAVAEERRYDIFVAGRLIASISSIPGALTFSGRWRPAPVDFQHGSGQSYMASHNQRLERVFRATNDFDALVGGLKRNGFRLEAGALRRVGIL